MREIGVKYHMQTNMHLGLGWVAFGLGVAEMFSS